MRVRVASSGAHSVSRSNSTASLGLSFSVGCGQSLAQTMRSGALLMYARAIGTVLTEIGQTVERLWSRQQHGVAKMPAGRRVSEDVRQEDALVDLEAFLVLERSLALLR